MNKIKHTVVNSQPATAIEDEQKKNAAHKSWAKGAVLALFEHHHLLYE